MAQPRCLVCNCIGERARNELFRCIPCDNIFQHPPTITAVYDAKYVHQRYCSYPTTPLMSYLRLGVVSCFVRAGSRILDIGYGSGAFLKAAASTYDCYGSDVHGVDFGVKDIPLSAAIKQYFEAVCFFDSVEHFADLVPLKSLQCNKVIVTIPHRPHSFPEDLQWKHYRPGEHLFYPSQLTLERLFSKTMLFRSSIEDAIRGSAAPQIPNTMTYVLH